MNETSKDAVVLMSAYNGQKYIAEQLRSIAEQDFQGRIHILIRDDGSKDGTIAEIRKIALPDNRTIEVMEEENIGPQKSFLRLLNCAPAAGYYFFADQDDVWDADKISHAVEKMEEENGEPAVYCSNYRLSDMDLKEINEAVLEKEPVFTPLRITFYNEIPGCTMGFNFSLLKIFRKLHLEDCMMHDSLVLALAAHCGEIIYDPAPRITHRIHTENVVGMGHKKIVWPEWFKEKLNLLIKKESYDLSETAGAFLGATEGMGGRKYVEDLELLRDYKKSCGNTFRLLRHRDSKSIWWDRTTMSIRCKILFHIF